MERIRLAVRLGLFEGVYVVLAAWLVAGAYLDALSYVRVASGHSFLAPWEDVASHSGWLALTAWLGYHAARGRTSGLPWTRSLPVGYGAALVAGLVFGVVIVFNTYETLIWGDELRVSALIAPGRMGQVAAGTIMVIAPLRAAWMRGDLKISWPGWISAALLLAALSFATQFADPVINPLMRRDPFAIGVPVPSAPFIYLVENLGIAAILLQAAITSGFVLMLMRRFALMPGLLSLAFVLDGVLGASLKSYWPMAIAMAATGFGSDLLLIWLRPDATRENQLRTFAAAVPAIQAAAVIVASSAAYGTWWSAHLLLGSVVVSALAGWLISFLVFPERRRLAHAADEPGSTRAAAGAQRVKEALEGLDDPARLAGSPFLDLAVLGGSGSERVLELRELLVDCVKEVAASSDPRDAEAGRVLFDYYVKRVGTHEVVAERLHLSRPTLFRRLQRGLEVVAERIDDLHVVTPQS